MLDELYLELEKYAHENYIPIIRKDSLEVLLDTLKKYQPKTILEIGTAIGYSGTKMLETLPHAKLYTMEINPVSASIARDTFKRAGVKDRVVLWEGDCIEILRYLEGKNDFIFLDGPKSHYLEMLPYLIDSLNEGGVIFADNVLFHGLIEGNEEYHKKITIIRNMREFLEALKVEERLDSKLLDIGDGITISIKRWKMLELLAPAGDRKKMDTALHFGADAVYIGGDFSLRAYCNNFTDSELKSAVDFAHSIGKKVYVTVNIFASNKDFGRLKEYVKYLEEIKVDAAIVSDIGIIDLIMHEAPKLKIHLSTQANTTNKYAVRYWAGLGLERVVLARELQVSDIREIKDFVGDSIQLETFVHGAMCISYSGRCLLSNYLTDRNSNRGECVQACRWEYAIAEKNRTDNPLTLMEDKRGSYILNSNDMCMLKYMDKVIDAGVESFKIEGRMKSEYYVGSVVSAYRRAIDIYKEDPSKYELPSIVTDEIEKTAHRGYSTGFYFTDRMKNANVNIESAQSDCKYKFVAEVKGYDEDKQAILVEQRNRFKIGDKLEILSNNEDFDKIIEVKEMFDLKGNPIFDAKIVQQQLYIKTDYKLSNLDKLRIKRED